MEHNNNTTTMSASGTVETPHHNLSDKWVMYAHLPHDTNWKLESYKTILDFNKAEQAIALLETIPDIMVNNCMLFLMRNTVKPIWEDPNNRKGGCFSFKVASKDVVDVWKKLCYHFIGETYSSSEFFSTKTTGITISPKRNFCIIKIWMRDCTCKSVDKLITIPNLDKKGVLFKKHIPEY